MLNIGDKYVSSFKQIQINVIKINVTTEQNYEKIYK